MAMVEKQVVIQAIISVDEDYDIEDRLLLAVNISNPSDLGGGYICVAKSPEFEVVEYEQFDIWPCS